MKFNKFNKLKIPQKIMIYISIFTIFIIVFTILYIQLSNHSLSEALHISVSTGTFAGATIEKDDIITKNISTLQLIMMYITIIILFHFYLS